MCTKPAQRGLSLIELIVAIVIISVGLVGILSVLRLSTAKSADPLVSKQAIAVADALMEEILSRDFGDYSAYSASFVNAAISGTTIFSPANAYQTAVSAVASSNFGAGALSVPSTDVYRIDVSVKAAQNNVTYQLTGYRFNYDQ
jgi:MSHA pilin protein MshD